MRFGDPVTVGNARGDKAVAWACRRGKPCSMWAPLHIAVRGAGERRYGPPLVITPKRRRGCCFSPGHDGTPDHQLAFNARGDLALVYGMRGRIRVRLRPRDGAFGPERVIAPGSGVANLHLDAAANVTAAWGAQWVDEGDYSPITTYAYAHGRYRVLDRGEGGPRNQDQEVEDLETTLMAPSRDGGGLVAWNQYTGVRHATFDRRGHFSRKARIGGPTAQISAVAAAGNGGALIVWTEPKAAYTRRGALYASVRPRRGAAFGPPARLGTSDGLLVRAGFDRRGRPIVRWRGHRATLTRP